MQEYIKKGEEDDDKKSRYFTLDESDCLILPPVEEAPELYVLGGFLIPKGASL